MPPSFRRNKSLTRNPNNAFKLIAAALVLFLYFLFSVFGEPPLPPRNGAEIQWEGFHNGTTGKVDEEKAAQVVKAMKHTFWKYKEHAWGADEILPVSGGRNDNRNGWGAFIVDSASTLAIMGLWEELALAADHIVEKVDFKTSSDVVDPYEATTRYLGGLLSLADILDAGVVPSSVVTRLKRNAILAQAVTLANRLAPAFDSPSGLIWPRVDFELNQGVQGSAEVYELNLTESQQKSPLTVPSRAGSNILENRVLSRLTGNPVYHLNATHAWSPLVWSSYEPPVRGMVHAPIDLVSGEPVGRRFDWDSEHGSFYEYLLKITILSPNDRYSTVYKRKWERAAYSLRDHLASRNRPSDTYKMQHLYMMQQDGLYELNKQSHLACSAAATVLLGGARLARPALTTLGQALLEACHHTYASTATHIGPETWSWFPKFGVAEATYFPQSDRQEKEWAAHGFWVTNPRFRLRPEYAESLFVAWRITGESRYREWAWDAFQAIDKYCKTEYGYAGLRDVMALPDDEVIADDGSYRARESGGFKHLDESDSHWVAETLKYFWLVFADTDMASLDRWVYSTHGHVFRMIR